jgi:lipoprotein-releasing system permease protein
MQFSFKIALRYLRTPGIKTFSSFAGIFAMIGLSIGVASLLLTSGILNGFEKVLSEKISDFDGDIRIQHFLNHPLNRNSAEMEMAKTILMNRDPRAELRAFIQNPALLRIGKKAEGVLVEGIESGSTLPTAAQLLVEGTWIQSESEIIIGKTLADKFDLSVGQSVVLFDMASISGSLGYRRAKTFTISGFFHSGLQEYDKSLVFTNLSSAGALFKYDNNVSGWTTHGTNPDQVESIVATLDEKLPYPYFTQSFIDKHYILFQWIKVQQWPIYILFGLITLVGLVNIISALSMVVLEKISNMGVLLALGIPKKGLRAIFLMKGMLIGFGGAIIGCVLAFGIGYLQSEFGLIPIPEDVYFMDKIPIDFSLKSTAIILGFAVLGSALASFWPASSASN